MGDYKLFPEEVWTIKEKDLIRVLHEAAKHGCKPLALINGMYYNLELDIEQEEIVNGDDITF